MVRGPPRHGPFAMSCPPSHWLSRRAYIYIALFPPCFASTFFFLFALLLFLFPPYNVFSLSQYYYYYYFQPRSNPHCGTRWPLALYIRECARATRVKRLLIIKYSLSPFGIQWGEGFLSPLSRSLSMRTPGCKRATLYIVYARLCALCGFAACYPHTHFVRCTLSLCTKRLGSAASGQLEIVPNNREPTLASCARSSTPLSILSVCALAPWMHLLYI